MAGHADAQAEEPEETEQQARLRVSVSFRVQMVLELSSTLLPLASACHEYHAPDKPGSLFARAGPVDCSASATLLWSSAETARQLSSRAAPAGHVVVASFPCAPAPLSFQPCQPHVKFCRKRLVAEATPEADDCPSTGKGEELPAAAARNIRACAKVERAMSALAEASARALGLLTKPPHSPAQERRENIDKQQPAGSSRSGPRACKILAPCSAHTLKLVPKLRANLSLGVGSPPRATSGATRSRCARERVCVQG